jgi:N utilization substance protein B
MPSEPTPASPSKPASSRDKRSSGRSRNWARRFAMQALYQWQLTQQDIGLINAQFLTEQDTSKADLVYFQELLQQTPLRLEAIKAALDPYLDRPFAQIDPVECAILWLAGYELLYRQDVPYRVVINEAVELAKKFGAEQGHRFINGVLDKAARQLRQDEIAALAKQRSDA